MVSLRAENIHSFTDHCMATKFCLKEFGNVTPAEYEIRNVNQKQLGCLENEVDDMPEASREVCERWLECLQDVDKKLLKNLLQAALGTNPSLVEVSEEETGESDCVHPETADPETWECDCLDEIKTTCNNTDNQTECFNGHMCNHCKICLGWKHQHCDTQAVANHEDACTPSPGPSENLTEAAWVLATAMEGRSQVSTRGSTGVRSNMDSALGSKCT